MANETRIETLINGDSLPDESEEAPAKRLLSLDFLRGLAIFMMVILHSFLRIADLSWALDFEQLFAKNFAIIIAVILLAYLGTFAGLFLLISIAVNIFASHKKLKKGISPRNIVLKQIFSGFLVLVIAYLTEMVLSHEGLLGRTLIINTYKDSTPGLDKFTVALKRGFHFETLHAIGWSIIIMSILHYIIVLRPKSKGNDNFLRTILIYCGLIIVIWSLTPVLQQVISNNYDGFPGEEGDDYGGKQWELPPAGVGDVFLRLFYVFLVGNLEPMFPYLGTAILGAIIGYCLSQEEPPKRLPLWIFIGSLLILTPGVIQSIIIQDLRLTYEAPTMDYYFISLFGQLALFAAFLFRVEFRGRTYWFKKISRYFRRWGVISLSIYSFEIFGALPRWIMHWITGWNVNQYAASLEWQTIITTIVVVLFWEGLIRLWELANFIGSWEWMIASITSIGKALPDSSRLNVKRILYNVEPITFVNN